MTHDPDLNAILERARKESYQAGYNAALQDVMRFANAHLGKPLEGISIPRSLGDARLRLVKGSLADLVLNKIEAHPDGIFAAQIKDWLGSGNSKYAGKAEAGKRVDTTLTRLKSRWGVIIKKDDGKWYPVTDGAGGQEEAA